MDLEKLLKVAKSTNEKSVENVNYYLECVQKGKAPDLDIQVFLYSTLITLHLEEQLIKQIETGIEMVREEIGSQQAEDSNQNE